jgi:dTDP-4-dehydrorhamnose 3,5-epimerase
MEVAPLSIQGSFVLTPVIHDDERGSFLEWFRADVFERTTGYPLRLGVAQTSVYAAGSVHGIHVAQFPTSRATYATCTRGEVYFVVVDLRVGSPTFGHSEAVSLDDRARKAVYLSEGLGHASMALQDDTVVVAVSSAAPVPEREHAVHPFDETLAIDWPETDLDGRRLEPLMAQPDAEAPGLEYARETGLLPSYEECLTWQASLREAAAAQAHGASPGGPEV